VESVKEVVKEVNRDKEIDEEILFGKKKKKVDATEILQITK
jgi:hypothetical protein